MRSTANGAVRLLSPLSLSLLLLPSVRPASHTVQQPPVFGAYPTGGPVHGGTRLRISGSDFDSGSVYRCKFGEQVVPATLVAGEPSARAASPGRATGRSSVIECVTPAAVRSVTPRIHTVD